MDKLDPLTGSVWHGLRIEPPSGSPTRRGSLHGQEGKRVFIHSEDTELAVQLVKLLDKHGVTAFWLTREQAEKLEQLWQWDACIRQVKGDGSLAD